MMGRAPCCEKDSVKRGPWAPEEDTKLLAHIRQHGTGSWRTLPKKAGLRRCGKSCRLRWTNYLRPDLKHGHFTDREEQLIVNLHAALGSRWSLIAAQLPGRTDNDVKNYWNTRLKKKLCELGIDPITHKPISQLLADLAGSMALQPNGQSSELSEAALGCFKDDMLHVLMRKGSTSCWQFENSDCNSIPAAPIPRHHHGLLPPTTAVAPVAVGPRQSWDHMMNTMSNSSAAASPTTSAPALAVAAGTYNEQPSQLLLQEQASSVPSLPNDQNQLQQVQDTVWQDYKYNWTKAAAAQTLKQNSGASAKGREEAMAYNMRAVMCSHSFCGPTADHQLEGALGSHASFLTGHAGQPVGHLLPHQVMMTGITQRPPTVLDHSEQLLRPVLEMTVDPNNNNNNSYHDNRACAEMMQNAGTPELELGPTSLCMSDMRDTSMLCKTTGSPWPDQNAGMTTQLPSMPLPSISDTPQMFTGSLLQDMTSQEPSSCSGGSQCQESSSHKTSHAATMEPWSPSPSGISSCSSTSLGGADRGQGGLDQVLGSDVFLWDFSDFTCMMN